MRYDWAGETPWCQEIHLHKLPASPAFLICIHSVSPSFSLLLHHASSPLYLSSSFSLSPLPHLLLPCLPLSVLLCLLSSCIAPPALWCSTDNQNSAHIRGCTQAHAHTGRHTPTTSGSPPPLLPLSHLSTADTKHSTTPGVPVLHQETLLARHQNSAFTHNVAYCFYHKQVIVITTFKTEYGLNNEIIGS